VTWDRLFYFPSEERHADDFFTSEKIQRLWSGSIPRTREPEASMLTTRPPKTVLLLQFAAFGSPIGLIHLVGFPTNIKGCYVKSLQQVKTCFCDRDELCNPLIVACINSSVSQSVCTSLMEWTQENTLALIALHQKMPVLWDPHHPIYFN
jgi:hypothetical protein